MPNPTFFSAINQEVTGRYSPKPGTLFEVPTDKLILAIDFDGTIVKDQFPYIGHPNENAIESLQELKSYGVKLILWTCRSQEYLTDAVNFCKKNGVIFDYINKPVPDPHFGKPEDRSPKPFAHMYLDDRSYPPFPGWNVFMDYFRDSYGIIKHSN